MGEMNSQILGFRKAGLWDELIGYHPKIYGAVISFGVGIALYFNLPFEPSIIAFVIGGFVLAMIYLWASRKHITGHGWVLVLCLIGAGALRAAWQSHAVYSPKLPHYERSYEVTGWVEAIERSGPGERMRIRVKGMRGVDASQTPYRVRLRLTSKAPPPDIGDFIRVRASAKAPPGPVIPGGYDPARRAYFDKIGGFGFTYGPPDIISDMPLPQAERMQRRIAIWRYSLAGRIMAKAPTRTAGLQAALMTGVRRYIPPEQTEALRMAGLAHILAISGLHMGLLAGGVYTALTFCLASIPRLARRYDVRKFAAIIGILAASFYLVLSGASVATQRAYVMAVIVFLAVIWDRRAISLRSVALAAIVTLMLRPESLVSVGFQMSFAAVAALVVTYQAWQNLRPAYRAYSPLRRVSDFFASLSVTSFVAGLATAGFALFHFGRMARYGLAGNILAMPIFSLAVMPLAVVSLILMPLGLERVPLWLMGRCIDSILQISNFVAGLTGAQLYVPAAPPFILPLFTAGFIMLCLLKWRGKASGILVIGLAFLIWARTPLPDIRISDQGQVAFWQDVQGGGVVLVQDSSRGDRYGRRQFMEMSARLGADWISLNESGAKCDPLACRAVIQGRKVSIVRHPSEVLEECAFADLVILSVRRAGPRDRRACRAALIDARSLERTGAISIYLKPDNIQVKPSRNHARNRPWS